MKTYLITGGAGFIGHTLSNRLVREGHRVIAVDNGRSGDWSRVDDRIERDVRGIQDLSSEEWEQRLAGVDVLFHLAAEKYNSSNSTPERVLEVNVIATDRLFRAAAGRVGKVVFTSSLYAHGSMGPESMRESDRAAPITHYGVSKLTGEHLLPAIALKTPLNWTVARLMFIYGPRQFAGGGYKSVIMSNFERIANGEAPTIYGDGLQSLDYVYVDDCIDALLRMAEHDLDGQTFNIASGIATNIVELTDLMRSTAVGALEPTYAPADWTHDSRRVGDPALLASASGWQVSTPISEGLAKTWRWMEDNE